MPRGRRKRSRNPGAMATGAEATRTPRGRRRPASSSASPGGRRSTLCPIRTTPGRWMKPSAARSPPCPSRRVRPNTIWHTWTLRPRGASLTSYERRTRSPSQPLDRHRLMLWTWLYNSFPPEVSESTPSRGTSPHPQGTQRMMPVRAMPVPWSSRPCATSAASPRCVPARPAAAPRARIT